MTLDLTNDLANLLDRTGRSAEAEPLFRDALERARKRFGPADPRTAGIMAPFGLSLIQQGKWAAAEPVLRECLAIREKSQPDEWTTFNTRSLLGGSLLGQKKYAEAEPLILSGYEGMKAREAKIPPPGKPRLTEAAERVVKLYEAWGKKDDAAKWRAKLARAERLAVAQVAYDQKKFAVATRLWAEELASDPKLGDDRQSQHRYNAARAAALAAAGQGEDAAKLDDAAKAKLRRQALDWLKAELAAWSKRLESGPPQDRPTIGAKLSDWQKESAPGRHPRRGGPGQVARRTSRSNGKRSGRMSSRSAQRLLSRLKGGSRVHRRTWSIGSSTSKDPNQLCPSVIELSQRIENGGADGEAAARLLLGHGRELAPEPNVKKLVDELVSLEKSALACATAVEDRDGQECGQLVEEGPRGGRSGGRFGAKLDPELVVAQMGILPEGYFAGELGDLERPLGFRCQGYSSLEVPLEGKTGELVYLGTVTLKPLAAGQSASLQGKVTLDDARSGDIPDGSTELECTSSQYTLRWLFRGGVDGPNRLRSWFRSPVSSKRPVCHQPITRSRSRRLATSASRGTSP